MGWYQRRLHGENSLKIQHIHNPTNKTTQNPNKNGLSIFWSTFCSSFWSSSKMPTLSTKMSLPPKWIKSSKFWSSWTLDHGSTFGRLEDKLKLNKHLEPLVTILPSWIQCSMDAIKELNNNLLPNLLRNLKKMVRNRK